LWTEYADGFTEGMVVGSEVFFGSDEWTEKCSA